MRHPFRFRARALHVAFLALSAGTLTAALVFGDARAQEAEGRADSGSDAAGLTPLARLTEAALEHFGTVRAADHAIAAAEAQLDEIRLSPFFRFEVTGGVAVAPGASGTPTYSPDSQLPLGNSWGPILSIEVRGAIPLYTFGKLRNARRAGRAGVRAAELDRERSEARVRYDVRRAYFALQLALDVQQMISEGRGKLRRAVDTLNELIEDDDPDANPMDAYRLAAALAEVESRASEVERLENASRAALATLSGIETIRIPDCPIARVDLDIDEVEEYVGRAHQYRPEVGMLDAARVAREAQLGIHRARFFPDLALALRAGYSWAPHITDIQNPFVRDRANTQSLGAGLVFRWNLDFAGTLARTRRAEAQLAELPGVQLALSAMTALTVFQQQGYEVILW